MGNIADAENSKRARVIVFGNEKGGSGKSTAAMHVAIGLLRLGFKVGTIDLDSHQGTLTSYIKNRWRRVADTGDNLPCPEHIHIDRTEGSEKLIQRAQDIRRIEEAVETLSRTNDFIIIDTPGSDRFSSIVGHSFADTLVTPMNDSFVDLDLLAKIRPGTFEIIKSSVYTDMVWDLRAQRLKKDGHMIDWVIMRNRLGHLDNKNKTDVGRVLEAISEPLQFRIAPGFGERVIFRELFLDGLTLLDLQEGRPGALSMSNITARQEVRYLIKMILTDHSVSTLSLLKTVN